LLSAKVSIKKSDCSHIEDKPDRIRLSYDQGYGYPVEFWVDPKSHTFDDEYGFKISGFSPLKESKNQK
jgi:hypothetical protein